jgi:hypothetical protein
MTIRRDLARAIGALALLLAGPSADAADRRAEAAAKDALKKAANDYLSTDYDAAVDRLNRALQGCGTNRCTTQTRATLYRDLGTMQFRNGDFGAARKSWGEALRLKQDIKLNPDYDSADLRAAWREAGAAGAGPQPTGDFTHTPAAAQKTNTPLPIYVEAPGGGGDIARVVLKYRSASMGDWTRLDMTKMGDGWGAQIPCSDVTVGTMRYWIQGFGAGGDPVASSGDPKRPFMVPITNEIKTEPPHFPGKAAPRSCDEGDCPPGLPGCAPPKEAGEGGEGEPEGEAEKAAESAGKYARIWVGASLSIDFLAVPSGNDLCRLNPTTALPANSGNFYCTYPSGNDFPARTPQGAIDNGNLVPGQAGHTDGGLGVGDVRVMLAADYAVLPNVLVGIRFGWVFNAYTGKAAVTDGRAFSPPLHVEARATYIYGRQPLHNPGFAPMGFAGLGISEFDWHTTSIVAFKNVALQEPVTVWYTDAPFFVVVGAGMRYQFSPRAAFTGAVRLNLAIGGNGVLPTLGPEVGVSYGF